MLAGCMERRRRLVGISFIRQTWEGGRDVGILPPRHLDKWLLSSRWRLPIVRRIWHLNMGRLWRGCYIRVSVRLLRRRRARPGLVSILVLRRLWAIRLLGRAVLRLLGRAPESRLPRRRKACTRLIAGRVRIRVAHGPARRLGSGFRVRRGVVRSRIWSRVHARIILRVVLRYLTLGWLRRLSVVLGVVGLR